jgi:hypothetical protein
MSGNMSTGVRNAASGPTIKITSASTTKVYGRRNAMRTRAIIRQQSPQSYADSARTVSARRAGEQRHSV